MRLDAPDLLLDMLVTHEKPMATHALLRAGELFGIKAVAIRVALTRLVASGKVLRDARGSYVVAKKEAGLLHTVSDWRAKHSLMRQWRGDWIAVQDSDVARSDKIAWRRHRLALDLWGFRALRPGLNLRPANLRHAPDQLSPQLSEVGLSPKAFVFQIGALPPAIDGEARKLWRAEQTVALNRLLLKKLSVSRKAVEKAPLDQAVAESFLMGREVIAHLIKDPLLPPALMHPASRVALLDAARTYQDLGKRLWRRWLA